MKRLKINITPYRGFFLLFNLEKKKKNLEGYIFESFFHKEIMRWTFSFLEITETLSMHWDEMNCKWAPSWSFRLMSELTVY